MMVLGIQAAFHMQAQCKGNSWVVSFIRAYDTISFRHMYYVIINYLFAFFLDCLSILAEAGLVESGLQPAVSRYTFILALVPRRHLQPNSFASKFHPSLPSTR